MPTFTDPVAGATEAYEAMRALAHASRTFDQPEDMYGVLGDLLGSVRSLEQVLTQIATAHENLCDRAADDAGDRAAGVRDALATAGELQQAAALIGEAERRLDAASAAAGRIAWPPTIEVQEDAGRVINVVFLQGGEADRLLDLIDHGGADAVIQELAGYDSGDETVDAALENGYVYDTPPQGSLDRTVQLDAYTLVYNQDHRHLGLYRQADALPSPVLLGLEDPRHAATTAELPSSATAAASGVRAGPILAREAARVESRRERLGAPHIHRQQPGRQAGRGLGR
ncbi:hypothetical protein FB468_2802 [Leucobacter komagatae]|uniref:Uncharacterized protein n=1 Tax=Leucobacter komagatae TaxID=55969 RepID=A0A542Y9R1_9MICO|nr:hypothetical protein [Leucobacter komagatae]TQL44734.1 hypothetical protein FB468_2802 [Leucobacter komagatae]